MPPIIESLVGHAAVWMLLGPLVVLAILGARRTGVVGEEWSAFVGCMATCCLGYLVFWAYLAQRRLGLVLAVASWIAACLYLWRARRRVRAWWREDVDSRTALLFMALFGAAYLAVLYLWGAPLPVDELAQQRFVPDMPCDNILQRLFAERLVAGQSPRQLLGDWLSSDRPPLQTGVILLTRGVTKALGIGSQPAAHSTALWFQLLWVPAVWGLLRQVGLHCRRAGAVVLLCGASGFFLMQSIYVWPKLAGGALSVGAFGLCFDPRRPTPGRLCLAAAAAALGWLSHGAVAFATIALIAVFVATMRRVPWPALGAAAGTFVVMVVPWQAYQRFYEPPGNRLLKWHLANVIDIDSRGTLETILDSYRTAGFAQTVDNKWSNVTRSCGGPFASVLELSVATADGRRYAQTFQLFLALGPWNLVWPLLTWIWWRRSRIRALDHRVWALALLWSSITYVVWVLLLFGPAATSLHQGPYSLLVTWYPILIGLSLACTPWLFWPLAAWHVAMFVTTWLPPATRLGGHLSYSAAATLVLATVGALAVWRSSDRAGSQQPRQLQ
jgi:hypothetical protein